MKIPSPTFIEPMTPRLVEQLPDGEEWIREFKLDGYRALLIKDRERIEFRSRKDKDLTAGYPALSEAGLRLKAKQAVLDGEIVSVNKQGIPSFQALQHPREYPDHTIVFYAFDLLHLNGEDWTHKSLQRRRARLPAVIDKSGLHISGDIPGSAAEALEWAREMGLEGVVAKRKDSPYDAALEDAWLKVKLQKQQEFVVGGYRPAGQSVDTVLVGYYEQQKLCFAGKVRAGLRPYSRRELFKLLKPLEIERCPFADLPNSQSSRWGGGVTEGQMREMRWVRPNIVVQIQFAEWTREGRLRHAEFLGVRQDKRAHEVHREA
jgi:bifunctional non-homologous end joining protein LigD